MTHARTGAYALMQSFQKLGVTTVFGVPGEETTALMSAIDDLELQFVLCRHEQGAAMMASVHGRMTGLPAVCLATLGPGATNLVTGVADAHLDHVPLIAVTGQGERARLGRESHQIIDLEALFQPVTKLSRTCIDPDDTTATAAEAYRVSLDGTPGAVHICMPEDVAGAETDARHIPLPPRSIPHPNAASIDLAAQRLAAAQSPLIIAGAGVVRSDASSALQAFSETTGIPVATSFMAKGVLPPKHDNLLFTVGQPNDDFIDTALAAADLVVAVGFDPIEYPTSKLTNHSETDSISISTVSSPVDSGWALDAQVTGDIASSLAHLVDNLDGKIWSPNPAFIETRDKMRTAFDRTCSKAAAGPIAPTDICAVLNDHINESDTVLSGVGLHKLWIARHLHAKRAGQVIIANGLAGMGLAMPGAVAAARLNGDGRVLAICGDGDVMMNVQEFETAARLGNPVVVMVWEDGGYGLIDEHQKGDGPTFGFTNPNWADLAKAFGFDHVAIGGLDHLNRDIGGVLNAAKPTLVTLKVDYAAVNGMPEA